MGLPSINITFKTVARNAIKRSEKGTVALILREGKKTAQLALNSVKDIPTTLGTENQDYIRRAFMGYETAPRKVLCYVLGAEDALSDGLAWLETQNFDYLAGPADITSEECASVAAWIKEQREQEHAIYKAVLPETAADSEAVVNFCAEGIRVGEKTYTAAQYASRIAGLLAGASMTVSCTYAPLSEVSDISRLSKEDADTAVEAGKLILIHDGEKCKIGRAVNSLQTLSAEKGEAFKKIKLVEAMDMIQADIRRTCQDTYIGRYPNSYDSKCILITAIKSYLEELERGGILQSGSSSVEIDLEAQEAYLRSSGVETGALSGQELKEANTGDKVFLAASIKILDAIEDIALNITV